MKSRLLKISKELNNRLKQYGFFVFFKRYILLKSIGFFFSDYKNFVLVVNNHKKKEINSYVKLLNKKKLDNWKKKLFLSELDYNRYLKMINNYCNGYYIEINNDIAAIGFVQTKGIYKYGNYFYKLPKNVHLLKNLFVKPQYRGMSLGKKINEARINNIPSSCIPCVFVISDNRYAIRNLKMYGFTDLLSVKHMRFFKKYNYRKIKIIDKQKITNLIVSGFNYE